ncbi:pilus assembly PilX family protein [Ramlibacter sp.]|uniref:pilus assembly PilX family protein n=1 Tax=Ramlibacter sp. TaxID=1917967 RepID=UPI003D0AC876
MTNATPCVPRRASQRGVSLIFSLLALVILAFGAVALMRSVDTGTMIVGNLAFKQDAVSASSSGAEQAINWLTNNLGGGTLNADDPANGYYASARDRLDVSGNKTSANDKRPVINWTGNCQGLSASVYDLCEVTPRTGTNVNGNQVRWVITRLCDTVGVPTGSNNCLRPAVSSGANEPADRRGPRGGGARIRGNLASPYYRIIVRVDGPRNTVAYTETLIHY